jgi:3-isopropylmalate dehydratase small subunit
VQVEPVLAGPNARYAQEYMIDISHYTPAVSLPGQPHHVVPLQEVAGTKIDSVFIGSCTNGRMEDMREAARILKGRKTAPGVVLKIVPSTDEVWRACLEEGLFQVFKDAGALVGNAGCAGCASGQIGQNGPGEKTVSTGNRNFEGKQGKGEVYLASVSTAAASAIAGHLTSAHHIPDKPSVFAGGATKKTEKKQHAVVEEQRPVILEGKVWLVEHDNVDTDMIYHNRHLAVTDQQEMGRYAFGNLKGWENYPNISETGDILIAGKNFGCGSSRQQAVDCFRALGNQAILARSFGAIYERNAINAGFPVLTYDNLNSLDLQNRDLVRLDLTGGTLLNKRNGKSVNISVFSDVQMKIYQQGDLLRG